MAIVTLNPNDKNSVSLSNGNLTANMNSYGHVRSTEYKNNGKWYWEIRIDKYATRSDGSQWDMSVSSLGVSNLNGDCIYIHGNGKVFVEGVVVKSFEENFIVGDILGISLDVENKLITFCKNGKWYDGIPIPEWESYNAYFMNNSTANGEIITVNFGATPFKYEIPKNHMSYDGNQRSVLRQHFLIKQNNQYYTIKPEFYQNGQFQSLTLEGGEQPNENDYENFGFDDLNDLLIPQNKKTVQGIDKGELGEGKCFEVSLDNGIKKVNNIE